MSVSAKEEAGCEVITAVSAAGAYMIEWLLVFLCVTLPTTTSDSGNGADTVCSDPLTSKQGPDAAGASIAEDLNIASCHTCHGRLLW